MSTVPMRITLDFTGGIKQALAVAASYEELYPDAYNAESGSVQMIYSASPVGVPIQVPFDAELPHHLQTLHRLTHGDVELDRQTTQDFHTLRALGFPIEFTERERMVLTGKHKKARKLVAKTMVEFFEGTEQRWVELLADAKGIAEGVPAYIPVED